MSGFNRLPLVLTTMICKYLDECSRCKTFGHLSRDFRAIAKLPQSWLHTYFYIKKPSVFFGLLAWNAPMINVAFGDLTLTQENVDDMIKMSRTSRLSQLKELNFSDVTAPFRYLLEHLHVPTLTELSIYHDCCRRCPCDRHNWAPPIAKFTSLTYLGLGRGNMSSSMPGCNYGADYWQALPLTRLGVHDFLNDESLAVLARVKMPLTELHLRDTITVQGSRSIIHFSRLETLFTRIPIDVTYLPRTLTDLNLSGYHPNHPFYEDRSTWNGIGSLPVLSKLSVWHSDGKWLAKFKSSSLKTLEIHGDGFQGSQLVHVGSLGNLENFHLFVSGSNIVDDDLVQFLLARPKLSELHFAGKSKLLTGTGLSCLLQLSLATLKISDMCAELDSSVFETMSRTITKLRLVRCNLTSQALSTLKRRLNLDFQTKNWL